MGLGILSRPDTGWTAHIQSIQETGTRNPVRTVDLLAGCEEGITCTSHDLRRGIENIYRLDHEAQERGGGLGPPDPPPLHVGDGV